MLTTTIISLLALMFGWKAGRSYSQGEGILEGYQIGYRDAMKNIARKPESQEWEFTEAKLN